MNDEEIKIERWSVCERYKNYKSNNYYKEPVQFRPHPENVVRDVIMYHIYHNEGKLCNDALIQYIKNKIIDDLNEIFMLYEYAPDAISMINRFISSKYHLGTEDSYNEMMFHALTIKGARDILIEQISDVLIKCIPEPLGNIKFDVIMKDETMDNMEQEETKAPKMQLRYLFRAWSDEYKPKPFIVKSVDKDEKYFEKTEKVDVIPSTTRSHCLEVYIFNRTHKIFLTTFVWKKPDYNDDMVTSFLEFVRVRCIPVQLHLTKRSDGYVNLHIETEDGKLWVDENCDDVMIESRNSTTLDVLCSGIEDGIRFTITDGAILNTIECISYMYTEIFEEQKKRPVISINIADGTVIVSNFWISRVLEQVSQYNECAYRFDRYEKVIIRQDEEGNKKYEFKEFIDEVVEPIVCKYLKLKYIRECNTDQTNNTQKKEN